MNKLDGFRDRRIVRRMEKKPYRKIAPTYRAARTNERGGIRSAIPPYGLRAPHAGPVYERLLVFRILCASIARLPTEQSSP